MTNITKMFIIKKWKSNLKDKDKKWNSYYEKLLDKFFKTKQWEDIKKSKSNNSYGKVFEYIVGFALADMKNWGFEYIVQKETSVGSHPNDGVDLIAPIILRNKKELWIIQVKTGKSATNQISSGLIKLETRAKEILQDAQNLDIDAYEFQKNWQISKKLAKRIKESNDWILKTFWVTDNKIEERPEIKKTILASIEKLIVKKCSIKAPWLSEVNKDLKFTIDSDFSNNATDKAIIMKDDKKYKIIITPIKIKDLLSFLEKIDGEGGNVDSLFILNVRDNKGNTDISKKIYDTLKSDKPFFEMNNGIIALCENMKYDVNGINRTISLTNVDIINGQQTIRSIWINKNKFSDSAKEKYILLQVYSNDDNVKSRLIASASNTQSSISTSEIISTYSFNKNLHKKLLDQGLFYQHRKGKTEYSKQFSFLPKISLKDVLKYASIYMDKNVWAKNNLNKIMKEIAFDHKTSSEVSQLLQSKNDIKINEVFAKVASIVSQANQLKSKIKVAQSFDIFSSLFMEDEEKIKLFINEFNKEVEILYQRQVKTLQLIGKLKLYTFYN